MKRIFLILISVILFLFSISCKKDLSDSGNNQNEKGEQLDEPFEKQDELVEQFIQALKDSTYTSSFIPYFNPEAITTLLEYADDYTPIYYFPQNHMHSYDIVNKKLGECLLWTIESIRVKYPYENPLFPYPSSVPMLVDKKYIEDASTISGIDPLDYRINNQQLYEVYEAYLQWWEDYNHENFEEIRTINPLDNLNYTWI